MAMLDQKNAMNNLGKEELKEINGGTTITGTIINAFTTCLKTVYDMGRSLGNSIRRINERKICPIS